MRILLALLVVATTLAGCSTESSPAPHDDPGADDRAGDGESEKDGNGGQGGDADDREGGDDHEGGNESASTEPHVESYDGSHPAVVGVCHEETGSVLAGTFQIMREIKIPANTSTVIVEARWEGTPTAACIDMRPPNGAASRVFHCTDDDDCLTDSKMRGEFSNPYDGQWLVQLGLQGAATISEFTIAVSSFTGEPPAGYTAI